MKKTKRKKPALDPISLSEKMCSLPESERDIVYERLQSLLDSIPKCGHGKTKYEDCGSCGAIAVE